MPTRRSNVWYIPRETVADGRSWVPYTEGRHRRLPSFACRATGSASPTRPARPVLSPSGPLPDGDDGRIRLTHLSSLKHLAVLASGFCAERTENSCGTNHAAYIEVTIPM